MGENTHRDWWDKADIIGKLISGVVLTALTIVIGFGANNVADSLKKGELVQSLVADLAQHNDSIRRDIALIALNRSVGKDDSLLVLEIVEHIYNSIRKANPQQSAIKNIAFSIIEERSPHRAKIIQRNRITLIASNASLKEQLRSPAEISPNIEQQVSEEAKLVAQSISAEFPKIVYVQFKGKISRDLVEQLGENLSKNGYPVPGVERVDRVYESSVRYFHKEDKELAAKVAKTASDFFSKKACDSYFQLIDLSNSTLSAQKGQIEIWINKNCNNVGLYALNADQNEFNKIRQLMNKSGYAIITFSNLNTRPNWLSLKSAVLYYNENSKHIAQEIADELTKITNTKFIIKQGNGRGIPKGEEKWNYRIHWIPSNS